MTEKTAAKTTATRTAAAKTSATGATGKSPAKKAPTKRSPGPRSGTSAAEGRAAARRVDPMGKHALFSAPPQAAPDQLGPGTQKEGRHAFFSTGPRQAGTVVVICKTCSTRSRISLIDLGLRLLSISAWVPGRKHSHWMRCPGCHQHRWCQVAWDD